MGITAEDMLKISKRLEKAEEDTTPHVGIAGDNVLVIGDANKTENKTRDYKALLRYPQEMAEHIPQESIVKIKAGYVLFELEFNDVHITPRNDLKIVSHVAEMLPFFNHMNKDGGVTKMTEDELIKLASEVSDEVLDSMYTVVGAVLGVNEELVSHFMYSSVLELLAQFIVDFPEVFNESDFFSEPPTERA